MLNVLVINVRSKCEVIFRVNLVIFLIFCNILFCFVDGFIIIYCGVYFEFFIIVMIMLFCWLFMVILRQLRLFLFGFKFVCLFKSIFIIFMCFFVDVIRSVVFLVLFWWFMLVFFLRNSWIMLFVFVFVVSRRGVELLMLMLLICVFMCKRVKQIFFKQKMDILCLVCFMVMVVFKNNRNKEMLL